MHQVYYTPKSLYSHYHLHFFPCLFGHSHIGSDSVRVCLKSYFPQNNSQLNLRLPNVAGGAKTDNLFVALEKASHR